MNTPLALSRLTYIGATVLMFSALRNARAQAGGTLVIGDVVSSATGTPLAHSMVTVLAAQRQTFTSDNGIFVFKDLDPGKYVIRAQHIGFSPADIRIEVKEGVPTPRIKIELKLLSIQLSTVKVLASRVCTTPGRPNPDVEPDFAAIVGQVRMNAEQFKTLSDSFPYQYKVEEEFYSLRSDSSRQHQSVESESFRSDVSGWSYKVGDVIGQRDHRTVMHLPTLSDFASYEFLNNHCFSYGGVDSTRDGAVIRIGFQVDVQIRTPDVNGAIFLDAKTYQIRRAELQLTKIPPSFPDATAIHVTTIFGEVAPSISIIERVIGLTSVRHHGWHPTLALGEDQRMYGFEWLKDNPAHPVPDR